MARRRKKQSKRAMAQASIIDARTYLRAGDHEGALGACLRHAEALGLDREKLWNTPTTDAVYEAIRQLEKVK